MLEKIAIWLSILVFLFWGWGIIENPDQASVAGWIAWTGICLSITISRMNYNQPFMIYLVWTLGNIFMVMISISLGKNNWGFQENIIVLVIAAISLCFSIVLGEKYPKYGDFLGGFSLACAYIPHIAKWVDIHEIGPYGLIIAALTSIVIPVLFGIHSKKTTNIFGASNTFAAISASVLLIFLVFWEQQQHKKRGFHIKMEASLTFPSFRIKGGVRGGLLNFFPI